MKYGYLCIRISKFVTNMGVWQLKMLNDRCLNVLETRALNLNFTKA